MGVSRQPSFFVTLIIYYHEKHSAKLILKFDITKFFQYFSIEVLEN